MEGFDLARVGNVWGAVLGGVAVLCCSGVFALEMFFLSTYIFLTMFALM